MCYCEIFVHLEAPRCPLSDCLFTFATSPNLSGLKKDVLVNMFALPVSGLMLMFSD